MPRPRIAIVAPDLKLGGGVSSVAAFLYKTILDSERYQPEFVSLSTGAHDESSIRILSPTSWVRAPNITVQSWRGNSLKHVGAILTELEFQRYLPRRILTNLLNEYDLVQIVAGTPAWALVAQNVNVPVVLQVATLASEERKTKHQSQSGFRRHWHRWMTKITERLDERACQIPDVIFVENQWMYQYLQEQHPSLRVIFAPPGVDTEFFIPAIPATKQHYLLTVGRLADPRKNTRLLFQAYAQLHRLLEDPPRLVLAGKSAPSHGDWQKAKDLGIENQIDIYTQISQSKLKELYQQAALFVLSSNEEGLGIVLLEAMACGTAVVSTNCGGPATIVKDGYNGFLTPVGNADALAQRIQQVLADFPLRLQMEENARRSVATAFSLDTAGQRFLAEYDRILSL